MPIISTVIDHMLNVCYINCQYIMVACPDDSDLPTKLYTEVAVAMMLDRHDLN